MIDYQCPELVVLPQFLGDVLVPVDGSGGEAVSRRCLTLLQVAAMEM